MSYTPDTYTDYKHSVRAATAAVLAAFTHSAGVLTATANGAFPAQDGVTLALDERILVKDETAGNAPYNGLFYLSQVGTAGTPWKLTRTRDADRAQELSGGSMVTVEEGTLNADTTWILSTDGTITLGTTSLTFTQISGSGAVEEAFRRSWFGV